MKPRVQYNKLIIIRPSLQSPTPIRSTRKILLVDASKSRYMIMYIPNTITYITYDVCFLCEDFWPTNSEFIFQLLRPHVILMGHPVDSSDNVIIILILLSLILVLGRFGGIVLLMSFMYFWIWGTFYYVRLKFMSLIKYFMLRAAVDNKMK